MKVYTVLEEENIRDAKLVREWTASGVLDPAQSTSLQAALRTGLRQTNGFLRAVLWIFTALIVIAGVALVADALRPSEQVSRAVLLVIHGTACWVLAEIACRKRLYRYGIEEALTVSSVVLLSLGVSQLFSGYREMESIAGLATASVCGLAVYYRFGFVYAAVGSLAAFAAIPFQWDFPGDERRLLAAILLAVMLGIIRRKRRRLVHEPAGSGAAVIEAACWLGIYLVLNLQLAATYVALSTRLFYSSYQTSAAGHDTWFYVFTWLIIWLMPAAGLWQGLRRKDRMQIDVSMAMALLTLTTNKRYLGWTMHTWDPMILGIVLMAAAILIRRWLQKGANGERRGFTSLRLFQSDERKLAAVGIASSVLQPQPSTDSQPEPEHGFRQGGGRSGGGGASGTF